ncbi:MAG: 50S ribosomal protein L22 [Bacteroidota bacterium]
MEARAVNRYVGTSPRKMRIVIDLIRGKSVGEAMNILHFQPKHAAKSAEKVLRSAVANFQNNDANAGISTDDLYVKEVYVNGGPQMKRILPAPMGRAYRLIKRSHHLTIVVDQRKSKK